MFGIINTTQNRGGKMRLNYSVNDLNKEFYRSAIDELTERYKDYVLSFQVFNKNLSTNVTPCERKDPVTGEIVEFDYPLAYNIWIIYNYIISEIDMSRRNVIENNNKLEIDRQVSEKQGVINRKWLDSRIGFLNFVAKRKLELIRGRDFSAFETGVLVGVSGQAIINRIKRDTPLNAKKKNNRWVVANKDVKRLVKESDSPILK